MYLKQIKMSGFKSFVDKTIFQFESGITGIVGPNGTGKSNIVDAVRWVLGEQSVKSLRGDGSMADVIFSGSKTRNPSTFASVTLVFDNEDKYFPLDYAEVSIKRLIYQTGENEYYLNGEKCRLKDITNLVIDTGLAKESFNIITQGNIQEILSNRPEERRIIFEEAAGVLKYKKRKEEALRKLDRTHDNINRINDIINELEQQLEPLRNQKEKAYVYKESKRELEETEISLIVNDIQITNEEYHYTKERIDQIDTNIIEVKQLIDTKEAELVKTKLEVTKTNELLYKTQQELLDKTKEVEKLSGEKNLLTERKKYNHDDPRLNDNAILLKEHQLKLKNELETANSEIETKEKHLSDLKIRINELETKLETVSKQKEQLLIEFNQNNQLQNELKYKINLMENNIANQQYLPPAVKAILNCPKLKGVHNIIGDLIDTDDQYKISIDVSLGGSAKFIVVDNEIVAKEGINYLKSQKQGRATFFPLNIIKPRRIDQDTYNLIKNHEEFIDVASNLVTYDECYQNIILNQLGAVIVTKTIDGANDIGKLINHKYKIVTLDGELLHIGGSITGGINNKNNSLLNDKYELEQLKRKLKQIKVTNQDYQLKLNDFDILTKEYQHKDYNLKIERDSLLNQIDMKKQVINESAEKLKAIENELKGITDILNQTLDDKEKELLDQYYETNKEKDKIKQKVIFITNQIKDYNEQLMELETELKKYHNDLSKQEKELQSLTIKHTRFEVKLDNLLNRLNEEYKMTFERAKKDYILVIDEKEAQERVSELKQIINDLGIVNIGALEEYERINKRYEFLINQKNDLYKAEMTLLEIIKEMDLIMKELFEETFKLIQIEFKRVFKQLFGGGSAEIKLIDSKNVLTSGIEIKALPPGKKLQHISLLSGGEKALTAIALLFAILKVRPVPFCLLDEVEAPLDENNVIGFSNFLKEFKEQTQFIVITHKKKTMEYVDVLYGITMQESGVSKLVSVKLKDINS
ncbi:MAG: AAA family ATPase [Bacilli bacterium]|jgi:chromosome segregation protein|nr:AAA family ATPase [Bacilli bacterium]